MAASASEEPEERVIVKLPEAVVNQIAAGEVVQRPANALKEMLENSIDAGAKAIKVVAAEGGLKLLRITDDGTGIAKGDLALLCERFATSKLRAYEDLANIGTFGFRGEALASISHVARLTVVTRTPGSRCAYRATYRGGRLVEGPTACAGELGTTMTVEELFHNSSTRRRSFLKSPSEQYAHIAKVVAAYATHYGGKCALTLAKLGGALDADTTKCGSVLEACERLHGKKGQFAAIGPVRRRASSTSRDEDPYSCVVRGYAAAEASRQQLLLFVNDRLVESSAVKRCVSEHLGGAKPFVYLALAVPPSQVDVNVHPTKREVHLLHESKIVAALEAALTSALSELDDQRSVPSIEAPAAKRARPTAEDPSRMVRTDPRDQPIEKFLSEPGAFANPTGSLSFDETLCEYDSIATLRGAMVEDPELARKLRKAVFVGTCDHYLLIQTGLDLCALDAPSFGSELFRQLAVRRFGRTPPLLLEPPHFNLDALDDQGAKTTLVANAAMLAEYFNVRFDENGGLVALPDLLLGRVPAPEALVHFLRRLARVDYRTELDCFRSVAEILGDFYAALSGGPGEREDQNYLQHTLFPALASPYAFRPPPRLAPLLLPLTSITRLFRVFERC